MRLTPRPLVHYAAVGSSEHERATELVSCVSHFAQAAKAESAGHHSRAVELARQSLEAAREAFPAEDGLVVALAWFGIASALQKTFDPSAPQAAQEALLKRQLAAFRGGEAVLAARLRVAAESPHHGGFALPLPTDDEEEFELLRQRALGADDSSSLRVAQLFSYECWLFGALCGYGALCVHAAAPQCVTDDTRALAVAAVESGLAAVAEVRGRGRARAPLLASETALVERMRVLLDAENGELLTPAERARIGAAFHAPLVGGALRQHGLDIAAARR